MPCLPDFTASISGMLVFFQQPERLGAWTVAMNDPGVKDLGGQRLDTHQACMRTTVATICAVPSCQLSAQPTNHVTEIYQSGINALDAGRLILRYLCFDQLGHTIKK